MTKSLESLLKDCTLHKHEVDRFVDANQANWAYHDPELGYLLQDFETQDGMNESISTYRYGEDGARKMIHYNDRPCRIHTYGNSFTQGHQVSDGETWQEVLAAHLSEPIRNYGVGGFGVYQAYLRLKRQEAVIPGATHLILNVWTDDHYRSIDRWRWIRTGNFRRDFRKARPHMFHANPWSHLRMDDHGQFKEFANEFPTPESLYKLCDEAFVYEAFKDDVIVHLDLAKRGGTFDKVIVSKVAEQLGVDVSFGGDVDQWAAAAETIHTEYALRASMYVIDQASAYAAQQGKGLMVLTSYSAGNVIGQLTEGKRFDSAFIDFLQKRGLPVIDTLTLHQQDYEQFRLAPEQYCQRNYVHGTGHYNPIGNHFFAFAILPALVKWLDPKPPAYRGMDVSSSQLAGWLA